MPIKISGLETVDRINQTNLIIDGSLSTGNNSIYQCEISGSSGFTLSNLESGNQYLIRIKATADLDVTLPMSANDMIRKTTPTASLVSGDWVDVVLDYDGTNRFWQVSELLASN